MNKLTNLLLIDQKTKLISHTKLFSNIGYILFIIFFIYNNITTTPIDLNLWLIFGTVVIGNAGIHKFINNKYSQD